MVESHATGRVRRHGIPSSWRAALTLLGLMAGVFSSVPRAQQPGAQAAASRWESHATWSPDSRRVAFESERAGNLDIVLRDVDTGQETPLTTDPADDSEPSWAPAGECLAFRSERDGGGLFVQCVNGAARRVAPDGHEPRWSRDGARLLYATHGDAAPTLQVVSRDGGAPAAILGSLTSTLVGRLRAVWTPDARIAVIGTDPRLGVGLWLLPEDAREAAPAPAARLSRLLVRLKAANPPPFELAPDGSALYLPGRVDTKATLFRLPIDRQTGAVRGDPEPIAQWPGLRADATISPSGARVAVGVQTQARPVYVIPFDAASTALRVDRVDRVGPENGQAVFPDFSPDGSLLTYTVLRDKGPPELRLWSAITHADVLLAADGALRFGPRWSPTGKALVYRWHGASNGMAVTGIRMIDLAARRESVITSTAVGTPYTVFGFSADGQQILVSAQRGGGDLVNLVRMPLSGAPNAEGQEHTLAGPRGYMLWQASTSPNGRWILVNIQPSNSAWSSIAVVPADGGTYRRLTTDNDAWDDKPRWSADGRTVFFLSRRSGEFELWRMGFDPDTGQAIGSATRVTSLTSPRRHVLREIGVLDLGLSASRLAVPVDEMRSVLRIDDVAAGTTGPALALCPSKDARADQTMPVDTDGMTLPLVQVSAPANFSERLLPKGTSGVITVETIVAVDGSARPVCVTQTIDRDLEDEALSIVRRWRFAPAVFAGKPVPALVTIGLEYSSGRRE